ncbi:hypothetical protein PsorP6_002130 [Peronosclerospora sorghi]|uniref:Uncharacterized protein n=1 Tax=Peronosclerospora sorghi TaxID=230839 RepID=A0ACC0WWR7_9STRA|nr:hypothetical protein PsorP6_002130 [Peronosclerospora sorghi]
MMALHGAPRTFAKLVIVAPEGRTTPSLYSFVTEHARDFAWEIDSVSWSNIAEWDNLNKTAHPTRFFTKQSLLLSAGKLLNNIQWRWVLIGIELMHAYERVLTHGLKARNIALWKICPYGGVHGFTTWVFFGMPRYGIYEWQRILVDRQPPFLCQARASYSYDSLRGHSCLLPSVRHRFKSIAEMNDWFLCVAKAFPFSLLERKNTKWMCSATWSLKDGAGSVPSARQLFRKSNLSLGKRRRGIASTYRATYIELHARREKMRWAS